MDMREFIICAAIHFKDGKKYKDQPNNITDGLIVAGRRHSNCYLTVENLKNTTMHSVENIHGFITSTDRFVNRTESYYIAKREGQLFSGIIHDDNPILISEELY